MTSNDAYSEQLTPADDIELTVDPPTPPQQIEVIVHEDDGDVEVDVPQQLPPQQLPQPPQSPPQQQQFTTFERPKPKQPPPQQQQFFTFERPKSKQPPPQQPLPRAPIPPNSNSLVFTNYSAQNNPYMSNKYVS